MTCKSENSLTMHGKAILINANAMRNQFLRINIASYQAE